MDQEAIRSDWVGRIIDERFTLLEWLGGSERSGVFVTELEGDGAQKAAIKLIPADSRGAESQAAVWELTATLSHPHLIRLFHAGRCQVGDAPVLYAVMEFADEILADVVPARQLTPAEARELIDPILDALSYLHRRGFVHSRLKPSNIVAVGDQLKLSCDGLHVAGDPGRHSLAPNVYDAPECATGAITPAADVWSLGVTLVEALTQHPPVWENPENGEPVVPESMASPFAGIARECLRTAPELRCTLSDVKVRLEPERPLPKAADKGGKKTPGKLGVTVLVSATLVLLAAFAALHLLSNQVEPSPPSRQQQPSPAIAASLAPSSGAGTQTAKATTDAGKAAVHLQPPIAAPSPKSPDATTPGSKNTAGTAAAVVRPQPVAATPSAPPASAGTQSSKSAEASDEAVERPQPAIVTPPAAPPGVGTQSSKGTTVRGEVIERILPEVPQRASETIHGRVRFNIRVTVDPSGNVSEAVLDSPDASKYFSNLALDAARKWKFKPAQVDGKAISSQWILRFQLERTGIDVSPVEAVP